MRIDFQNFDLVKTVTGMSAAGLVSEFGVQTAVQTLCHQPVNPETDWLALGSLAEM